METELAKPMYENASADVPRVKSNPKVPHTLTHTYLLLYMTWS